MSDIRRFEKRVLQHTEFDDDEGFDENTQGYESIDYTHFYTEKQLFQSHWNCLCEFFSFLMIEFSKMNLFFYPSFRFR